MTTDTTPRLVYMSSGSKTTAVVAGIMESLEKTIENSNGYLPMPGIELVPDLVFLRDRLRLRTPMASSQVKYTEMIVKFMEERQFYEVPEDLTSLYNVEGAGYSAKFRRLSYTEVSAISERLLNRVQTTSRGYRVHTYSGILSAFPLETEADISAFVHFLTPVIKQYSVV